MAEEAQYTLKRKYDDQPTAIDIKLEVANAKQKAQEAAARLLNATAAPPLPFDPKRTKSDNGAPQSGFDSYDLKPQYSTTASYGSSKKIEIPNGRVGVLIGKSGETIKYLQLQSGAKIQVTRDMDADPNSTMRMVELTGTSDAVASAEKLINDVLAEAEAGGTGGGTRRMAAQSGGDEFAMQIPNNKVGLIIGKGGETIKSMQASTGARIQVIPLHLPPGDTSTERTLKINGALEQIESAKQLVNQILTGEMDKASILGDAANYMKELQQQINDLQSELESSSPGSSLPPLVPVKEELCHSNGSSPKNQSTKVEVREREGGYVDIHVSCTHKSDILFSTMKALDSLGLDVHQAVINCFNGFSIDVFKAKQYRKGQKLLPEQIKAVLLNTLSFHGMM